MCTAGLEQEFPGGVARIRGVILHAAPVGVEPMVRGELVAVLGCYGVRGKESLALGQEGAPPVTLVRHDVVDAKVAHQVIERLVVKLHVTVGGVVEAYSATAQLIPDDVGGGEVAIGVCF